MELYTPKQARARLGNIHPSVLQLLVKKGKLRRIVKSGETRGFYSKEEVDQLAREREEFDEKYTIVA